MNSYVQDTTHTQYSDASLISGKLIAGQQR